jgi:hypothetical protein
MGYKDDFIQRLKDDKLWQAMTEEEKKQYESMSDAKAGEIMASFDSLAWDEETQKQLGYAAAMQFITAFKGALVQKEGDNIGKLSKAGILFAKFLIELEKQGIPIIEAPLELNNSYVALGATRAYKNNKSYYDKIPLD